MIPDVTPNGVFYLPPTGWLTSFYNPPLISYGVNNKKIRRRKIPRLIFITFGYDDNGDYLNIA